MDPLSLIPVAGGLLSGLFNAGSQSSTNKTNLQIARETNASQMALAQYQADQNLNLWHLNNAYNSPAEQMERYKQAGLNPNLIYGNGSSSAGNSSSPAQGYQAPTLQRATLRAPQFDVSSLAQSLQNGIMNSTLIAKNKAETQAIYQNIENLRTDNEYKGLQIAYQNLVNSKTQDEADMWKRILNAREANLLGSAHLSESNVLTNELVRPQLVELYKAQISNYLANNDKIRYELENILPKQSTEILAKIANLAAQSTLYRTNSQLSESNISLNREREKLMYLQEEGQYQENQIRDILRSQGINLKGTSIDRAAYLLTNILNNLDFGGFNPTHGLLNQ